MKDLSLTEFVKKTIDSLQAAKPEGFELDDVIDFEVHVVVNQDEGLEPSVDVVKKGKKNDSSRSQRVTFSFVNPAKQQANAIASAKSTKTMMNAVGGALIQQIQAFMAAVEPKPAIESKTETAPPKVKSAERKVKRPKTANKE